MKYTFESLYKASEMVRRHIKAYPLMKPVLVVR
jgi:hypothetical protein